MNSMKKVKLSPFQIMLIGFLSVILIGSIILMFPFASKNREYTPFIDSLFTSTSAVCVTGLVVFDTATHWSLFGQIVILLLIQIGGMGVVMMATSFALISGRKIGLFERDTLKEAISAPSIGGIVRLTGFVLKGIITIEFLGAILLLPVFIKDYGTQGIWMAIFHSISAFCNAGFDIMGSATGELSSLTSFSNNAYLNIVVMLLIIIGGIGFLTWEDIATNKFRISKYRMQSKVVLIFTLILIFFPALYFFLFEFNTLPIGERIFVSLFQAVTPRTAGFNTIDLLSINGVGIIMMMFLMLVGGAPGSTAGGMKVTTLAVLFSTVLSAFKNKDEVSIMKRRIEKGAVRNATTLLYIYISLFLIVGSLISLIEGLPVLPSLFEAASALGTVGLSLSITASLGVASKIMLMILMLLGRVGSLTFIHATLGKVYNNNVSKYPVERITVG